MSKYLVSVGMEVHAELSTASKMFCRCEVAFGGEPNTRVCPVCLGLPGALPVPNRQAIELVLKTALALNCKIAMRSIFHRKNYFYPDLPKGFQTTQYGETNPFGYHGFLEIPLSNGGTKKIRIRRVHLEEDTGKLMHLPSGGSGVDYNRSGVPLMEIVTDFPPDIESPEEAKEYLVQLRNILLYVGVCDGKLEEGSMRCEPNISIRLAGTEKLGTKTELKNLNSYRAVQMGVEYEAARMESALEAGEIIRQETRGWNETKELSFSMRLKEEENDYRYFPCPDLVPMSFDQEYIDRLRAELPELPLAKAERYKTVYGFSDLDVGLLTADRQWASFFEECVALGGDPKLICNWMNSDFAMELNKAGISARESKISPAHLVDLTKLIVDGTISGKIAKEVFAEVITEGRLASDIVKERGLTQISDRSAIESAVKQVINEHPEVVSKFKAGQVTVAGFLVGKVIKAMGGRANPNLVQELVKEEIER